MMSSQKETINFPSLDFADAQTFLENERDGKDQRGGKRGMTKGVGRHTDILQTFFNDLDYKQSCLLLKMANVKEEECRQEAARLVQEGIAAGKVDITRVEEYDEDDNSLLDEFGAYVVATGAGTLVTDIEDVDFGRDELSFIMSPQRNLLSFSAVPENDGTARRVVRRNKVRRERGEACVSLEAHAWQVPEAQDLYRQAAVFRAVKDRSIELLRYKFEQHHADLGAELMLNVLTELIGE